MLQVMSLGTSATASDFTATRLCLVVNMQRNKNANPGWNQHSGFIVKVSSAIDYFVAGLRAAAS